MMAVALDAEPSTIPKTREATHDDVAIPMRAVPQKPNSRVRQALQGYWRNLIERPSFLLLPPILVFCVVCSLSIVGVVLGCNKYESDTRTTAGSAATDWAASFRLQVEKATVTPLTTLAILIKQHPHFPSLAATFPDVANELLASVNQDGIAVQVLQISPFGIVSLVYPENNATITGLGLNIFTQPALSAGALFTVQQHDIVINGPTQLVGSNFGTIARVPIFIKNSTLAETFGTSRNLPDKCPNICFNTTTGEKFWGFATAIGPLDDLKAGNDTRLKVLKDKGYNWLMTRPYTASELNSTTLHKPEWTDRYGQRVFSNSSVWPSAKAVDADISVGKLVWKVYLEPTYGWRPSWERGLLAAVILGNCIVAVLVGIIMASWAEQQRLLGDVMESNVQLEETTGKLQEEKEKLDTLLVRQYNLLAVLGGRTGGQKGGKEAGSSLDNSQSSSKGLTLERIESMRRQLAVNTNTSAQELDSIQCLELLGEGTFGKVYRGLWRGTVVAVKTMLLPANMSGAEKREKMAVMEAAISSTLSHPNIIQTYTYAIKPLRENDGGSMLSSDFNGAVITEDLTGFTAPSESESATVVHSYEVRLVLEFCDKGCLRDALDAGALFLSPGVVNYLAILDTAADVAKAMLHLHSLNVLHSDLKARNVLLATGSTDGRGVVGKVGDFGLSLQMNHLETHISAVYQGTMTHMAPEIMLQGRVSKAADVYAFGVMLWEMFSGARPFEGIPRALLGHQITKENLRPRFPEGTPKAFQDLAERCWHADWEVRPSFGSILEELLLMRAADPEPTPPVNVLVRMRSYVPLVNPDSNAALPLLKVNTNNTSPLIAANLPQDSVHSEGDSDDDSHVLVLRGLCTGGSTESRPLTPRSRPSVLPQITEGDPVQQEQ